MSKAIERLARLEEIKNIFQKEFGGWRTIYKPLQIEKIEQNAGAEDNYQLIFSCDCYFEPIFLMFMLSDYEIVEMKVRAGCREIDHVTISDGNLNILRQLDAATNWAQKSDLEKLLTSFGCKKIEKEPDTGPILIDEDEHQYLISRARWNAYWASKGLKGPSSGWEIPTYAQIMEATKDFVE